MADKISPKLMNLLYEAWLVNQKPATIEKILSANEVINESYRSKELHFTFSMKRGKIAERILSEAELIAEGILFRYNIQLGFTREFKDFCASKYPEATPIDILHVMGVRSEDVGLKKLDTLTKKLNTHYEISKNTRKISITFSEEELKELKNNPYVKSVHLQKYAVLTSEFLNELHEAWLLNKSQTTIEKMLESVGLGEEKIGRKSLDIHYRFLKMEKTNDKKVTPDKKKVLPEAIKETPSEEITSIIRREISTNIAEFASELLKILKAASPAVAVNTTPPTPSVKNEAVKNEETATSTAEMKTALARAVIVKRESCEHPYIIKNSDGNYELSPTFYNDAKILLRYYNIDTILSVCGLTSFTWIKPKEILQKLERWISNNVRVYDDTMFSYRLRGNRIKLMEVAADNFFGKIKASFKQLQPHERKEICQWISQLPQYPGEGFTIADILKKCGIAKSTYYKYVTDEEHGLRISKRLEDDKTIVQAAFDYGGFHKGTRQVFMLIPRLNPEKKLSYKKVCSIMKKAGMNSGIRQSTNRGESFLDKNKKPNILRRRFHMYRPNQVRVTDVTYLYLKNGVKAYGSALMDPVTGRLIAFNVSNSNDLELVIETLRLSDNHPCKDGGIFHSDQGVLYHTDDLQKEVSLRNLKQSMSDKGDCWDNAVIESFFGHFKDECEYRQCDNIEQLKKLIDRYAHFYNNMRGMWKKGRMTPIEYEQYLLSMTEEQWQEYMDREEAAYEEMKKEAARKAIERNRKNLEASILQDERIRQES